MNKNFLIIAIIIAIIAVGAGGFILGKYSDNIPINVAELEEEKNEVAEKETGKCASIQNISEKNQCWIDLAKEEKDESHCKKISADFPEARGDCYTELAIFKDDSLICEKIISGSLHKSCLEYFEGNDGEDETADWKSYENKKYGYSFKYPKDCFYGPMPQYCKQKPPEERPAECLCFLDGENQDSVFIQVFTDRKKDRFALATFSISHPDSSYYDTSADTDLIEWLKKNFSELHKNIPDKPNMKIGGIDAVKIYTPFSGQAGSAEDIYFIKNGKLLHIYIIEVDNAENRKLYDQILSTFKFIEADETANWRTYESDEYKINYPENCSIKEIENESAFCPGDTQEIERLEYIEIENCNTFIDIYSNPNNLTIQEWNNIYRTLTCTGSGLSFNVQTSLNNLSVTKGLFGCCSAMQKVVAISKNNKVYLIHSREVLGLSDNSPDRKEKELWLEEGIDDSDDIFNQILSTFKFTE